MNKIREFISGLPEAFGNAPAVLKNKVLRFFALGAGALIFAIVLIFTIGNYSVYLPCFAVAVFGFVMSIYLLFTLKSDRLHKYTGECVDYDLNLLKNSVSKIYIDTGNEKLCINVKEKITSIEPGKVVTVYLLNTTFLYQEEDYYIISDYLALDIKGSSVTD